VLSHEHKDEIVGCLRGQQIISGIAGVLIKQKIKEMKLEKISIFIRNTKIEIVNIYTISRYP